MAVLYIASKIVLLVYTPSYMSFRMKDNMVLSFQTNNINVFNSKQYKEEDLTGLHKTVEKSLEVLKQNGIQIKSANLFFFRDYGEAHKYKFLRDRGFFEGLTLGSLSVFVVHDFDTSKTDSNVKLIVHELVHVYQYERLGVYKNYIVVKKYSWKAEGFSEFVSKHSYLNENEGGKSFLSHAEGEEYTAFFYFLGRLRTDYLLRHKGVSEEEYWETDYDTAQLDEEIRAAINSGEYIIFKKDVSE